MTNTTSIPFDKSVLIPKMHKICNAGEYTVDQETFDQESYRGKVLPISADTEYNFYILYLKLLNIQIEYEKMLNNGQPLSEDVTNGLRPNDVLCLGDIDYLALFLVQNTDKTVAFNQKTDMFKEFGEKLNRTKISAKNAFDRIKRAGYLVLDEDKFWVPCPELQQIRKVIKTQIKVNGFAIFSYVFNSVISNV